MSKSTMVSGMVAVEASHTDPAVHTVHGDGALSVRLTNEIHNFPVYLRGTPDQLHALADKLRAIVTAHESQTTLAGEAAREVTNVASKVHECTECGFSAIGPFGRCPECHGDVVAMPTTTYTRSHS